MKKLIFFSIFLSTTLFLPARTIYVNLNANGFDNGTSWANAYKKLLPALENAQNGDSLWIAQGLYKRTRAETWDVPKGVSLFGGFQGNEVSIHERNFEQFESILGGVDDNNTIWPTTNEFSWHVLYLINANHDNHIDGITITGGKSMFLPIGADRSCTSFASNNRNCIGGGIFLYSTETSPALSLIIKNCKIRNNSVRGTGGGGLGVYAPNIRLTLIIENCIFKNNSAGGIYENDDSGRGGGIYIDNDHPLSSIEILGCQFIENINSNYWSTPSYGAGITVFAGQHSSVKIKDCDFVSNNGANVDGASVGGLFLLGGKEHTITNCEFKDNKSGTPSSVRSSGLCPALYVENSIIKGCKFFNNYGFGNGAVSANNSSFTNCIFYKNSAKFRSPIFFAESYLRDGLGEVTFNHCTFANNTTLGQGGFAFINGRDFNVYLNNNVFIDNYAQFDSSNFGYSYFLGTIMPLLTIHSNNNAFVNYGEIADLYAASGGNVIINDTNSVYSINPDFIFSDTLDYRLSPCSPLLNLGSLSAVQLAMIDEDIDGNPRIIDGLPDLGAWETVAFSPTIPPLDTACYNSLTAVSVDLGHYQYAQVAWSSTNSPSNGIMLGAGSYSVIATVNDGCADTLQFTIVNSPSMVSAAITATPANGGDNGTATVIPSGGYPPYTLLWSTFDTATTIENLPSGFYEVIIRDAIGCGLTAGIEVPLVMSTIGLEPSDIQLYPNPTHGIFYIQTDAAIPPSSQQLEVVDVLGKTYAVSILSKGAGLWEVQADHLPKGVYWLKMGKGFVKQ